MICVSAHKFRIVFDLLRLRRFLEVKSAGSLVLLEFAYRIEKPF